MGSTNRPSILISIFFLTLTVRYKQNGILHMLDRNRRIKPTPERFQSNRDMFDVVVSCEERVYDQIIEGKLSKTSQNRPNK